MTRDTFKAKGEPAPEPAPQHPIQPLELDDGGILRFKQNAVVRKLLDVATANGYSLNEIVRDPNTTREDLVQLYQLIGYSLAGYGELQAVSDTDYEAAEHMFSEEEAKADRARVAVLEGTLKMLREDLAGPMGVLFGKHPDDFKHGRGL